jgi:hypothetical protein
MTITDTNYVLAYYSSTDYSAALTSKDESSVNSACAVANPKFGFTGAYSYVNLINSNGYAVTISNGYSTPTQLLYEWEIASAVAGSGLYSNYLNITYPIIYYKLNTFRNIIFEPTYDTYQFTLLEEMNPVVVSGGIKQNGQYGFPYPDYNKYTSSNIDGMTTSSTVDSYNTGVNGPFLYQDTTFNCFVLQQNVGDFPLGSSGNINQLNPFTSFVSGKAILPYPTGAKSTNAGWNYLSITPFPTSEIIVPSGATPILSGFFASDYNVNIFNPSQPDGYTVRSARGVLTKPYSLKTISNTEISYSNINLYLQSSEPQTVTLPIDGVLTAIPSTFTYDLTTDGNGNYNISIVVNNLVYSKVAYTSVIFTTKFSSKSRNIIDNINVFYGLTMTQQSTRFDCISLDDSNNLLPLSLYYGNGYDPITGQYGVVPPEFVTGANQYNPFTNIQPGVDAQQGFYVETYFSNNCSAINSSWMYIYST